MVGVLPAPTQTSYRSRKVVSITVPGMERTVVVEMEIVPYLRFTLPQLHCSLAVVVKERFIPDRTLGG